MIKFATMQHHLPTTTLASFYALLALFFSFHEAHGQTPKPQAKNMAESLTVFKELFAIGLPGQKDVKILNREGIKKILKNEKVYKSNNNLVVAGICYLYASPRTKS